MTEEILAQAIQKENEAKEFYTQVSAKIIAKNAKKAIEKLAKDEAAHVSILSRRYNRLFNKDFTPAFEGFSDKHKIAEAQVYDMNTSLQIVSLGIGMEDESILFYADQYEKTADPEERKMLKRLAQFERGHKKKLQHQHARLKKGYSWNARG